MKEKPMESLKELIGKQLEPRPRAWFYFLV